MISDPSSQQTSSAVPPRLPTAFSSATAPIALETVIKGSEDDDQLLFRRFSRVRLLGQGGLGMVYLARDRLLNIEIALKFIDPKHASDPTRINDLKKEILSHRQINHSGVLDVYEWYEEPKTGLNAIAMEYAAGGSLRQRLAAQTAGCFEVAEIEAWLQQLCQALAFIHQRGIIHRDLKPENLLFDKDGSLKIADFGLAAKIREDGSGDSFSWKRGGTPGYMSFQQFSGDPPSASDDVFSLGCIFFHLLTGSLPFSGSSGNHEVPRSMKDRRNESKRGSTSIPEEWEEIVATCLAQDVKIRPPTVENIRRRLWKKDRLSDEQLAELERVRKHLRKVMMGEAERSIGDEKWNMAQIALKELMSHAPGSAEAQERLLFVMRKIADKSVQAEDWQSAESVLKEMLMLKQNIPHASDQLVLVRAHLKEEVDREAYNLHLKKGSAAVQREEWIAALEWFEKAASWELAKEEWPEASKRLISKNGYKFAGKLENEIKKLSRQAKAEGHFSDANNHRAKSEFPEAITALRACLEAVPHYPGAASLLKITEDELARLKTDQRFWHFVRDAKLKKEEADLRSAVDLLEKALCLKADAGIVERRDIYKALLLFHSGQQEIEAKCWRKAEQEFASCLALLRAHETCSFDALESAEIASLQTAEDLHRLAQYQKFEKRKRWKRVFKRVAVSLSVISLLVVVAIFGPDWHREWLYQEGVAEVTRKNFGAAIVQFQRIEATDSHYKDTARLRRNAQDQLAQIQLTQYTSLREEAEEAERNHRWWRAMTALQKARALQSNSEKDKELAEQIKVFETLDKAEKAIALSNWSNAVSILTPIEHHSALTAELLRQARKSEEDQQLESKFAGYLDLAKQTADVANWDAVFACLDDAARLLLSDGQKLRLTASRVEALHRKGIALLKTNPAEALATLKPLLSYENSPNDTQSLLDQAQENLIAKQNEEKRLAVLVDALSRETVGDWDGALKLLRQAAQISQSKEDQEKIQGRITAALQRKSFVNSLDEAKKAAAGADWSAAARAYRNAANASQDKEREDAIYEAALAEAEEQLARKLPDWSLAAKKLDEAYKIRPSEALQKRIDATDQEVTLVKKYAAAQKAIHDENWSAAVSLLDEILKKRPIYRDATVLIKSAILSQARERLRATKDKGRWQSVRNLFQKAADLKLEGFGNHAWALKFLEQAELPSDESIIFCSAFEGAEPERLRESWKKLFPNSKTAVAANDSRLPWPMIETRIYYFTPAAYKCADAIKNLQLTHQILVNGNQASTAKYPELPDGKFAPKPTYSPGHPSIVVFLGMDWQAIDMTLRSYTEWELDNNSKLRIETESILKLQEDAIRSVDHVGRIEGEIETSSYPKHRGEAVVCRLEVGETILGQTERLGEGVAWGRKEVVKFGFNLSQPLAPQKFRSASLAIFKEAHSKGGENFQFDRWSFLFTFRAVSPYGRTLGTFRSEASFGNDTDSVKNPILIYLEK